MPLLILHGWGGSSESWVAFAQILEKQGYRIIIPDLPGFGQTPLTRVFTLDDYAKTVEDFCTAIGLPDVILFGHSNGGAISIRIIERGNLNVQKLVLNNSAGIRNKPSTSFKRKVFSWFVAPFKFIRKLPGGEKLRAIFYRLIGGHDYLQAEQHPFLRATYLNMIATDLQTSIQRISVDTLLLWGADDTYTPLADGKLMHQYIPGSRLIVLKHAKHGIHLQDPLRLAKSFMENI